VVYFVLGVVEMWGQAHEMVGHGDHPFIFIGSLRFNYFYFLNQPGIEFSGMDT